MNCKKCGAALTGNDQFCKNCGTPVNEVNAQLNQMGNQQSINQNYDQSAQQAYGNSINYNYPQQKNNTVKYIIFAVLGAIAIMAIVIFVVNKASSSSGGIGSGLAQTSTYKVNFKGFSFNVPDNLVYEEGNGILMIGDQEGTWLSQIEIEEGNFSQLKANKSKIQSLMQQNGYTSSVAEIKTLGGVEFITLELSASGTNTITAFAEANSMYFIALVAVNLDNEFDYSLLEILAPIISSASYSGETSNMEIGTKIDMSKMADLAK